MSSEQRYPRRLIEVDLPIKEISAHARREKSLRRGTVSTLHIWWARRPLAACRAVLCGVLWVDPADPVCSQAYVDRVADILIRFTEVARQNRRVLDYLATHWSGWNSLATRLSDPTEDRGLVLRKALLDFISDFSDPEAAQDEHFAAAAGEVTRAAHIALGEQPTERPLVFDPFAGGGAIPVEALRVGADAFASDLNPIAVLLNTVLVQASPSFDAELAESVRASGVAIRARVSQVLRRFYPPDPDGATPIAYLWARTIRCEGPACGYEVPLLRSLWLAKAGRSRYALKLILNDSDKRVDFEIVSGPAIDSRATSRGTIARGATTCPRCGFTTKVANVRRQLTERSGGGDDARLVAVVTTREGERGRQYRTAVGADLDAVEAASQWLSHLQADHLGALSLVPDEEICINEIRRISVPLYGIKRWGDIHTRRQALAILTLADAVRATLGNAAGGRTGELKRAVGVCLALAVNRTAENLSSVCRWNATGQKMQGTFGRQAIAFVSDFCETTPFSGSVGDWTSIIENIAASIECAGSTARPGVVQLADAVLPVLPHDSADAFVTDPPYYDAVPYAHLSDFFYVWARRMLVDEFPSLFRTDVTPKEGEIVVDRPHRLSTSKKDVRFYEEGLRQAFEAGRLVVRPQGIGLVVFASKTTSSWEAILQALLDAGWTITASWPIDSEMGTRMNAMGTASLASSVHIVCRPRENLDGSLREDDIGDWRSVLRELPRRIHEWMPRLAKEGVVGADAIFACIGPALEIFSRYSRVEKASGEKVELREYLEQVWAAVAREALSMIFDDADATGLEEDARLTAMWLWTLAAGSNGAEGARPDDEADDEGDDDEAPAKAKVAGGFSMEFDAARKIAQGLGAHLEDLKKVVEIKGDTARLLGVAERTRFLFGKDANAPTGRARPAKAKQMSLFAELEAAEQEAGWGDTGSPTAGESTLDRIHQAMILFAAGRGEALKRFLVDEGVGRNTRFWKLAQSLSALYPSGTEEKRWVDGVLARKKGLGF